MEVAEPDESVASSEGDRSGEENESRYKAIKKQFI